MVEFAAETPAAVQAADWLYIAAGAGSTASKAVVLGDAGALVVECKPAEGKALSLSLVSNDYLGGDYQRLPVYRRLDVALGDATPSSTLWRYVGKVAALLKPDEAAALARRVSTAGRVTIEAYRLDRSSVRVMFETGDPSGAVKRVLGDCGR